MVWHNPLARSDAPMAPGPSWPHSLHRFITFDGSSTGCTLSVGVVHFTTACTGIINANQPDNAANNAEPRVQQVVTATLQHLAIATAALPKELKLNKSTGVVSGTPKQVGTSMFTVEVPDTKMKAKPHTRHAAMRVLTFTIS